MLACPNNTFDCTGDGTECLNMRDRCDGAWDCTNIADESNCGKGRS